MAQRDVNTSHESEKVDLHEDVENLKAAFVQIAEDLKAKVKEKSDDLEDNMFGYVKKYPARSIAVSVLAGMLLAKLMQK